MTPGRVGLYEIQGELGRSEMDVGAPTCRAGAPSDRPPN